MNNILYIALGTLLGIVLTVLTLWGFSVSAVYTNHRVAKANKEVVQFALENQNNLTQQIQELTLMNRKLIRELRIMKGSDE